MPVKYRYGMLPEMDADPVDNLARLVERLNAIEELLATKVRQSDRLEAVVMVLLDRLGDVSRVTVKEAAAIEERLYGKGSVKSVRAKIHAGIYTLEKRSGEKQARIPVSQIYSGYLPIDVWRKAIDAESTRDGQGRRVFVPRHPPRVTSIRSRRSCARLTLSGRGQSGTLSASYVTTANRR